MSVFLKLFIILSFVIISISLSNLSFESSDDSCSEVDAT